MVALGESAELKLAACRVGIVDCRGNEQSSLRLVLDSGRHFAYGPAGIHEPRALGDK